MSWDEVYDMQVTEFFAMLGYIKEKSRKQQEELEKWKMKHRL